MGGSACSWIQWIGAIAPADDNARTWKRRRAYLAEHRQGLMRGAIFARSILLQRHRKKSRVLWKKKRGKWSLLERGAMWAITSGAHEYPLISNTETNTPHRRSLYNIICCVRTDAFANGHQRRKTLCILDACVQHKSDYSKERGWQIELTGSKQHEDANFVWIYEFSLICIRDQNARNSQFTRECFRTILLFPMKAISGVQDI